jgi:cysteine desulfurase
MVQNRIYLDYNATTPCDDKVVEAMLPYFSSKFGNASSKHHPFGWEAKKAVDLSRNNVANLLGCSSDEIIFTSGATESLNMAIKGVFHAYSSKGKHFITCQTEHSAVLDTLESLEKMGAEVEYLPVDNHGNIDLALLESLITDKTLAVCIMWANNETGVIHDIPTIAEICQRKNVFFIVDGTQVVGKLPISVQTTKIDLLALSGHKMYGPKGVGALYINKLKRIKLLPLFHGGGHERSMRSGTLNVPGIVGLSKAAQIVQEIQPIEYQRLLDLQGFFEEELSTIEETFILGKDFLRLPNTTNICIRFAENEQLLSTFNQNIAVSTGSACSSEDTLPSHVLTAMGLSEYQAKSCLRISFGKYTTKEELEITLDSIKKGVDNVRSKSPKWQMFKSGYDMSEF